MYHRVDARERRRHVLWPRQVSHHGAARPRGQLSRAAQEHAHAKARDGQRGEQVAADEAGRAGERDQRPVHAVTVAARGLAKFASR